MKVLVLHAPALHLGFVGCYGNAWVETPNLDRLAAEAVVFDQHFVADLGSRWDLPKGVVVAGPTPANAGDATPLELALESAVAAVDSLADRSDWVCWAELPSLYPPWILPDTFATRYLTADSDEEGGEDEEPFEPLRDPVIGPLDPDDLVLWERLRCTYAGAVTYLDAGLGLLVDELNQRGLLDELLLIVTSDRGLALGEHGIVGDAQPWLHEEVVHVPLIMRQPQGAGAGRRIAALTQSPDLMATLAEVLGVQQPVAEGHSLLPVLRSDLEHVREHTLSHWTMADGKEWAMRTPEWALLLPKDSRGRSVRLYAKPEDRWEVNNVIQHHLELAEDLEKVIQNSAKR